MLDLVADEAMRLLIYRYVLVASQGPVALQAAEVLDVPEEVLGPGVLGRKDELVARMATRDGLLLGVVPGAVDLALVEVVQEVD